MLALYRLHAYKTGFTEDPDEAAHNELPIMSCLIKIYTVCPLVLEFSIIMFFTEQS